MPPDARDDEFIRAVAAAVASLVVAVERGDRVAVIAQLNGLLAVLVEHGGGETRRDTALRRAVGLV
jgi:hypothetical protein